MPGTPANSSEPLPEAGFAHVATLAFVAARAIPGFGFPVSVVGGTAVAHATEELGGRRGGAAGVAAAIESVAILGPSRMSGPGGQLVTAPLIGELQRHGRGPVLQVAACATVRAVFNLATTLIFIVIIAGGIDNYTGTYEATIGQIPGAPQGAGAALIGTLVGIAIWSIGASAAQVWTFRRATRRWAERGGIDQGAVEGGDEPPRELADAPPPSGLPGGERQWSGRFDPRAVTAAALVAFILLLLSTSPPLLGAVAAWLAIAWWLAPAEAEVAKPGLVLAATLALSAFLANWIGGDSVRDGLEHAARGALLVMTATWMRGAAGSDGVREVARRAIGRFDRLRSAGELRSALDSLAGDRRMGEAVRGLIDEVRVTRGDLEKALYATIDWAAEEAARFRPGAPPESRRLEYGPLDLAVLVGAALPALTLAPG